MNNQPANHSSTLFKWVVAECGPQSAPVKWLWGTPFCSSHDGTVGEFTVRRVRPTEGRELEIPLAESVGVLSMSPCLGVGAKYFLLSPSIRPEPNCWSLHLCLLTFPTAGLKIRMLAETRAQYVRLRH